MDKCARLRQSAGYKLGHSRIIAMSHVIYKIVPEPLWASAEQSGRFEGAPVDLADGFIHFSTASQVRETAARHFKGQAGLLLVAIDADRLGEQLKYEPSRGGNLFPHLYASLTLDAVIWKRPLPVGPDGSHVFPEELV
ncbi:DUF952 domain-containing protein [Rhizobium rhizoryzae]